MHGSPVLDYEAQQTKWNMWVHPKPGCVGVRVWCLCVYWKIDVGKTPPKKNHFEDMAPKWQPRTQKCIKGSFLCRRDIFLPKDPIGSFFMWHCTKNNHASESMLLLIIDISQNGIIPPKIINFAFSINNIFISKTGVIYKTNWHFKRLKFWTWIFDIYYQNWCSFLSPMNSKEHFLSEARGLKVLNGYSSITWSFEG